MDRVFLDANVLFSAAYRPDSEIARLWTLGGIELLSSEYARGEAERNLPLDKRAELARLISRLAGLMGDVHAVELPIELPEKDKPIMQAAISARATHLLTGDVRHFGAYYGQFIAGVLILPPGQYLQRLESST